MQLLKNKLFICLIGLLYLCSAVFCGRFMNQKVLVTVNQDNSGNNNPKNITDNSTDNSAPKNNTDTNKTDSGEVYNINYDCPEGKKFDTVLGKCIDSQAFDVMWTNRTTSTKHILEPDNLVSPTIVEKLVKQPQYDEKRLKPAQIKKK